MNTPKKEKLKLVAPMSEPRRPRPKIITVDDDENDEKKEEKEEDIIYMFKIKVDDKKAVNIKMDKLAQYISNLNLEVVKNIVIRKQEDDIVEGTEPALSYIKYIYKYYDTTKMPSSANNAKFIRLVDINYSTPIVSYKWTWIKGGPGTNEYITIPYTLRTSNIFKQIQSAIKEQWGTRRFSNKLDVTFWHKAKGGLTAAVIYCALVWDPIFGEYKPYVGQSLRFSGEWQPSWGNGSAGAKIPIFSKIFKSRNNDMISCQEYYQQVMDIIKPNRFSLAACSAITSYYLNNQQVATEGVWLFILEEVYPPKSLDERETYWQEKLGCFKNGYNIRHNRKK
jgi:hypothetical protein